MGPAKQHSDAALDASEGLHTGLLGRVIDGKYRVDAKLGEGGMGLVFRATHLTLEHAVAIKVLRDDLAREPDVAERFSREARTMALIDSPYVVKVLDVGHLPGGQPFMVMEFAEGEDLLSRLARGGPLHLAQALNYVLQASIGLAQAHDKGIIHRDLKPENLYVVRQSDGSESIKLLDFGIARHENSKLLKLTQPQVPLGSPAFMSPEQLLAQDAIDARADLWSLGVVLYQVTTGSLPFDADSIAELYAKVLHSEPLRPSSLRADLPRRFDRLVFHCLSKAPEARPASALQLARMLHALLESLGQRPSCPVPLGRTINGLDLDETDLISTRIVRSVSWRRGRSRAMLGFGCVALMAGAVWAWAPFSRQSQPKQAIQSATRAPDVWRQPAPAAPRAASAPDPGPRLEKPPTQREPTAPRTTHSTAQPLPRRNAAAAKTPTPVKAAQLRERRRSTLPDFGGRR